MKATDWLAPYRDLKLPPLKKGAHKDPSRGLCAMEMVAFLERLPHSDRPPCTSPVIAQLVISVNDFFPDQQRARLLPWLPRVVGTVAPEFERVRAYEVLQAAFDVLVGLHTPTFRHLHVDGVRRAYPPWDYGRRLGEMELDRDRWHVSPYLHESLRQFYAALTAVKPESCIGDAVAAVYRLCRDPSLYWAREPQWQQVQPPELQEEGKAPTWKDVEVQVRNYRPDFETWCFERLERVLAIGPASPGFTLAATGELVDRMMDLAEYA